MSNPIRVLFAAGTMGGGGSERQMLRILQNLDRSRFTPMIYIVHPQGELLHQIPQDVPVIGFWNRHEMPRLNFPGRIHRWQVSDLENTIRQFHIDLVYDRTFFMSMLTGPACRRTKTSRLSVIVCEPHRDVKATGGGFLPMKRWLLKRSYHQATRVLTVSDALRDEVIWYYDLPPQQVVTMRNFVDFEQIEQWASEPAPAWEPERFHIVAAGRLHEQKGYGYLLDALAQLVHERKKEDVLLHILGQGPLEEQLKADVRSKRLQWNVCMHGFVANPYPYFRAADLYCLSSIYEGMPNALMEAMVCGVPVLSTDCPTGPREILEDGALGSLIEPADPIALADAINHAVDNYDDWQARVGPAREHVETYYSPEVRIGELENLMTAVCRS